MVSPGGTVAVLRPDKVQAILKALQTNANVRIESAPRILVNDNAVGSIASIAEEPTTQINQGQTTTTTSFAGFVQAGTQFAITPHISETDYLRVQYSIILNAFGAKSTDPSIPPPRSTSSIQSEATVPDGATIVVGGLQSTNERTTIDKVPLLGDIPLIGLAFRNTIIKKQHITTYLFITTTIMKNTDFSDLRDATNKALKTVRKQDDNTQLQPGDPNEQSNP
jgi:type II secretory pathway component GspD/PulD (secretin)